MAKIRFGGLRRRVPGLRDDATASEVKVFKANTDGTPGRLLRIERTEYRKLPFNRV